MRLVTTPLPYQIFFFLSTCQILSNAHHVDVVNMVALLFLARTVDFECYHSWFDQMIGLDSLAVYLLDEHILGKDSVRTSNWMAEELTQTQLDCTSQSYLYPFAFN